MSIDPNSISRIERGRLIPAFPTLIDICNALEIGADAVLAAYTAVDIPTLGKETGSRGIGEAA